MKISKIVESKSNSDLKVILSTEVEGVNLYKVKNGVSTLEVEIKEEISIDDAYQIGESIYNIVSDFEVLEFETSKKVCCKKLSAILENIIVGNTPINHFNEEFSSKINDINIVFNEVITQKVVDRANKNAYSYNVARMLNHLPHSVVSPDFMATQVKELFSDYENVEVEILREKELKEQGYNGHLAVSAGSKEEPALIKVSYKNGSEQSKTIGVVGKGLTFDMGGYNIKTQRDIRGMKKDMGGANGVIGAMLNLVTNEEEVNVNAYLCVSDNLINENALLPGDVITYKNGLTVEVGNTDAEGRLVLADGLLKAQEDNCDVVIDIATLTGAIVAAIGNYGAGLFSYDKDLNATLSEVGQACGEYLVEMPVIKSYEERIKSDLADIINLDFGATAGSIIAYVFLNQFVKEVPHIHIDMAAMSDKEYLGQKANGYGTRILSNIVKELS